MIPLLIALLAPRADLAPAQLLGRVRAFAAAAHTGLDANEAPPSYAKEGERPKLDDLFNSPGRASKQQPAYDFANAIVWVDRGTGQVWNYVDEAHDGTHYNPDGTLAPPKISVAQAALLARRFFAAAGWGESVVRPVWRQGVLLDAVDGAGSNDRGFEVRLLPSSGGVPYDEYPWETIVQVHRDTGQLAEFHGPGYLPQPPARLIPSGSLQAAREVALRFGTELRGEALVESSVEPFRLRLWLPRILPTETRNAVLRRYGSTVISALDAGRALLVYRGTLLGGSWQAGADVTVDARTGEVLSAESLSPPGTAGGAGGAPKGFLDVPTAEQTWRVANGAKGWNAWTAPAKAFLVPVENPPPAGAKVTLTDGKAAFPATYDPKTGLLCISGKAYRPGPALANLLKRRVKG